MTNHTLLAHCLPPQAELQVKAFMTGIEIMVEQDPEQLVHRKIADGMTRAIIPRMECTSTRDTKTGETKHTVRLYALNRAQMSEALEAAYELGRRAGKLEATDV